MLKRPRAASLFVAAVSFTVLGFSAHAGPFGTMLSNGDSYRGQSGLLVKIKKDNDDRKGGGDPASLINDPPPPNDLSTQGYPFSIANPPAKCANNTCEIAFVITNGGAVEFKGAFGFSDTLKVGWVQKNVMMPVLEAKLISQTPAGWTCTSGTKIGCSAKDFSVPGNSQTVIPLRIKFKAPAGVSASFIQHAFLASHNGSGGIIGWAGTATSLLDPPLLTAKAKSEDDRADFEGTWSTSSSGGAPVTMKLKQKGKQVTGTYTPLSGTMSGEVSGNTLSFKWTQPTATGTGIFTMLKTKPKSFKGTYTIDGKPNAGGVWSGTQVK